MQVFIACISAPILIIACVAVKFSGIESLDFGWPSLDIVLRCTFVAATASTAHWLAYIGISRAGAAQVAPAIYVQMLVAVTLGWAVFGDVPDLYTVLGAGLIIAAGLYLWRDGLKQSPTQKTAPKRT
jgi:drug/metabolite transporter (DMT)-like permease